MEAAKNLEADALRCLYSLLVPSQVRSNVDWNAISGLELVLADSGDYFGNGQAIFKTLKNSRTGNTGSTEHPTRH